MAKAVERPRTVSRSAARAAPQPTKKAPEPGPRPDAGEGAQPRGDLTPVVGKNLRRFRAERGLSLEGLSKVSGVSRAMLGQVELGHSTPTINVVWEIARALDLPFSALISEERHVGTWVLPRSKARLLTSSDGVFTSRALTPMD